MFEKIHLGLFVTRFLYSADFKQNYIYEEPFHELLLAGSRYGLTKVKYSKGKGHPRTCHEDLEG